MSSVELSRFTLPKILARPSGRIAVLLTAVAIVLATGVAAIFVEKESIRSRNLVVHTYSVRDRLSELETARANSQANAFAYLLAHRPDEKSNLGEDAGAIREALRNLRQLVRDNPRQVARVSQMETLIEQQIVQLNDRLTSANSSTPTLAPRTFEKVQERQAEIGRLATEMDLEEQNLLRARLQAWNPVFRRGLITIGISLALALFLLVYSYRLLNAEVATRKEMELLARENTESYRALSARILELQDIERRKIARELHDSVGQFLAGLKMNLGQLSSGKSTLSGSPNWLPETMDMTDQAIGEIRTISHLLHPPLLDELGLESAARWYADEFAKRSGTRLNLEISGILDRLPRGIELALFRVLQESLTNVHRHAKAKTVDVSVTCGEGTIILEVADDGKGVPSRILQQFHSGAAAGIGLSGMRERLAELHGTLEMESSPRGTTIRATLPTLTLETEEERVRADVAAFR